MNLSLRSFTSSRLLRAVAALWLCGSGAAWAGDGGGDLGTLNSALSMLCSSLGVSLCPQAPSVSQGILQLAAWNLLPNEMIGATNSIPLGQRVNAGNPSIPPVGPTPPPITAFPVQGATLSTLLGNSAPLAFISSSPGPAQATQLYNINANMFLYAIASGFFDKGGSPDTVFFFYDDTSRTNSNLPQGQIVAQFSLPLVVLNTDNTERLVPTTLQFRATNAGDCSTSTVVGNFSGASSGTQTLLASQIGINCAVVFAPSPLSTKSHAIFEVAVPLVLTVATDPLYIVTPTVPDPNPIANVGSPFVGDIIPPPLTPPPNLGANGKSIGMSPAAVPLCTPATCPTPPTTPPAPVAALCANLPGGNGNGQAPVPAVAAYYAISTAGETLLSAAVPSASTSVCQF